MKNTTKTQANLSIRLKGVFGISTMAFVALILFTSNLSFGQAGALDLTFNPNDQGFGYGDGLNGSVSSTAVQSDGKILIAGDFTTFDNAPLTRIARLNEDGSLDMSFNAGTGPNGLVRQVAIQGDGKIIVAGDFSDYDGTSRIRIARLNTDGSLDLTFSPGTGPVNLFGTTSIRSLKLQSDGRILISGSFTVYDGTSRIRIARLNSDGSLDGTFNPGAGADALIQVSELQSDGKIVIGGSFSTYNGSSAPRICRLNADGTLDAGFMAGTGATGGTIQTISIQGDGKILIGGSFTAYNGITKTRLARLNIDGSLDVTYGSSIGPNNTVSTSVLQNDGKLLIGGNFTNFSGLRRGTARLNLDGSLDITYNPGDGVENFVSGLSLQADGKVIVSGGFTGYNRSSRNYLVRVESNGNLDTNFNPSGTGANAQVKMIGILSNGRIAIGGSFDAYNGFHRSYIETTHANGMSIFSNGGGGANNDVNSVAFQSDGSYIIGGEFTNIHGIARNRVSRQSGGFNASFNPGSGANSSVLSVAVQGDDKIIIGGSFTSYDGVGRSRIARLNTNGTLDTSFDPGSGANATVRSIAIQSDGKILIVGDFTTYNGVACNRIARLNSDGTQDASFTPGTASDHQVLSCVIQQDGKILIGGWFNSYDGTSRKNLARLNTDGSLDLSFNSYMGPSNQYISTIAIQDDDRILIGGLFSNYDGSVRNNFARINPDGTLDSTFDPGTGTNGPLNCIAIDHDGRIMIGGSFTGYNGIGRNRIARIWADTDADGDGIINVDDGCPFDANKTEPGLCGCGVVDIDSDNDGVGDCNDLCPFDPNKSSPGQCGCGTPDLDDDCDGFANCIDQCPHGDDNVDNNFDGNPDCQVYPGFDFLLPSWTCSNNNNSEKVLICHDGTTLCVSENSLAQHLGHGDNIGPCQSCSQELIQMPDYNIMQADEQFEVFPNPVTNVINIKVNGFKEDLELIVTDQLGRVMRTIEVEEGITTFGIDVSNDMINNGIYYISIKSQNELMTRRVVVVK